MAAVGSRRTTLVEFILQQGVDPDSYFSEKYGTLLDFARAIKVTDIVEALEAFYERRATLGGAGCRSP